jgi:hypothetical protein
MGPPLTAPLPTMQTACRFERLSSHQYRYTDQTGCILYLQMLFIVYLYCNTLFLYFYVIIFRRPLQSLRGPLSQRDFVLASGRDGASLRAERNLPIKTRHCGHVGQRQELLLC